MHPESKTFSLLTAAKSRAKQALSAKRTRVDGRRLNLVAGTLGPDRTSDSYL